MAERQGDVPEADAQEQERPWVPQEQLDENPRLEVDDPDAETQDETN